MESSAQLPALPSEVSNLRGERILASPQFRDGAFRNTLFEAASMPRPPWSVMKQFMFDRSVERVPTRPISTHDPRPGWAGPPASGLRTTWLGHSTVLVEIGKSVVLTDPVWGLRASPMSFMGPKRFFAAPVAIEHLPRVDVVLISHDHYDHLCKASVLALANRDVIFVTSLGVGARLERWGIAATSIVELDWGEGWSGRGVTLCAEPAQHFSGRTLRDRNSTLWASWVIKGDRHQVFFSGDTGLTPQFAEVHRKHGAFDMVMLEIGAYHDAWGSIHMGPHKALQAFDMLGGGTLLPVHWGTFNLGLHAWDEPIIDIVAAAPRLAGAVITPPVGRVLEPTSAQAQDAAAGRSAHQPWW